MLNIHFHFFEFKIRFFYILFTFFLTFFVSYVYIESLIYLYTFPLLKFQLLTNKFVLSNFIFTNVFEVFSSYVYLSGVVALYFTFFISLYNCLLYIQLGLLKYEKELLFRLLYSFIVYINFLTFIVTQLILPIFLNFFFRFENLNPQNLFTIRFEAKILEYIHLNNKFILCIVIIGLIPFILFYLFKLDLISIPHLKYYRRFFILGFFILGAIFSPPDIYSQLLIAIPLSLCFELTIFLSYLKNVYFFKFDIKLFKKQF